MTLILHHSGDLPPETAYDCWFGIAGAMPDLPVHRHLSDLAAKLESAFEEAADGWLNFACEMSIEQAEQPSHVIACATNVSDFGEMLAWARICAKQVASEDIVLAVCDDPWLFRHIAETVGTMTGAAPGFTVLRMRLAIRGFFARISYALKAAADSISLASHRRDAKRSGAWLLVYGHPRSNSSGADGYFGDLPKKITHLWRVLHVDCPRNRAQVLKGDGRTVSLRGWGNPVLALTLPFRRWRPAEKFTRGTYGWLVRRAAALEGGTAQAAAIEWQIYCQRAWLNSIAPDVVAWPWENHVWERAFTKEARKRDTSTLGYQHSVVGRYMLNYSPASLPTRSAGLPDRMLCTGPSTRNQLLAWGVPAKRIDVGGALRFSSPACPRHDPEGPIFVALPFDHVIANEMMVAIRHVAKLGRRFVVRDHPMTPFQIEPDDSVQHAEGPLESLPAVSSVIYAATTVGLEALVGGLPTLRFRSRFKLSVDILPPGLEIPTTEISTLAADLDRVSLLSPIDREHIFAQPDMTLWHSELNAR
ncbi:MAG: hypothetical protein CFH41_01225 [Alphaproteobacteria bacterium MarineAlpha11_Bin1]|nr:MAG: hypothetical protein CFH41_01225 [Alphaproteobacteria bacterium MarineAlpha11_Bin1]